MASATSTGASFNAAELKSKVTEVAGRFTTGQKVMMGAVTLAVVIAMIFIMKSASKTEMTPLYSNLKPADAAAVTEKLTAEGSTYELSDGGGTIMVPKEKVYDLRLAMAAEGLPASGPEGYSLLDKQGITASEFSQQVGFQRAMEGELTKTIDAMDPIASSTVHLAMPKEDVFASDKGKASASVLVKTKPGKTLDPAQVQAVVHLVASSVQGLDPNAVTVADSTGAVLAQPGEDGGGNAASDLNTKQTKAFEKTMASDLEALILPVVGSNKSKVTVSAELDFSQRKTTSETFQNPSGNPAQSTPQAQTNKNETYTGPGASDAGVLGPDGAPVAGGATNGATDYNLDQTETKNALNRAVEETKAAPGTVKRLSVAVLVDAGATSVDQINQIENLVSAGAGISQQRGDTVQVSRMAFGGTDAALAAQAKAEQDAKDAEQAQATQSMMRQAGVALFLLGLLFFAYRAMRKSSKRRNAPEGLYAGDVREVAVATTPEPLPLESGAIDLDEEPDEIVGLPEGPPEPERSPEELERDRVSRQVEELVDQQPTEVAQMLRGWLGDGKARR
jgi:flagellar M-ring protein FliF